MIVEIISNNFLEVNTYFLIQDNNCLLIDPGSNTKQIIKIIDKNQLNLKAVVLTHAHFDHFMSCNEINQIFDVPIYIHSKGIELLYDASKNVSDYVPGLTPLVLNENILVKKINEETKDIEGFKLNVFHVPGHSPDSICIYFKDEKIVFSGDALFKLGVGRTDFYYGNEKQLYTNIKNKLFKLPEDTLVYPGHGEHTTIGFERKNNPYIR